MTREEFTLDEPTSIRLSLLIVMLVGEGPFHMLVEVE